MIRRVEPNESNEVRVAQKLLRWLQQDLGELAPKYIEIASSSDEHILVNLHYDQGKLQDGRDALNTKWMVWSFALGGTSSSFIPHDELRMIQASMNVSLARFERGIDDKLAKKPGQSPNL